MRRIQLKGVAWDHSRAFPPLVATAQRFEELHPEAGIVWEKRSLHAFGHASLAQLAQSFDLVVVDHPMMGDAEATGSLVDLLRLLKKDDCDEFQGDSAGPSFESYLYHRKLFALPIDAASPAASFRPDLLAKAGFGEPKQWSELLELARNGLTRMPGFSADVFLNFMGLCASRGGQVAATAELLVERQIGVQCLEELRELASVMPSEIYEWNPIALYEQMSSTDEFAYCPFAYTYSNYSRAGFAPKHIRFGLPVNLADGTRIRTVLGGTGIAISTSCAHAKVALEYCLFVAGRTCQKTLYGVCGGQPARRSAWEDNDLNDLTDGFFRRTLPSIEAAYTRPRYPGYARFQARAGLPIANYLRFGGNANQTLDLVDDLYRANLVEGIELA